MNARQPGRRMPTLARQVPAAGVLGGFRGDEMARLQAQFVTVAPGADMLCYLPRTKTDHRPARRPHVLYPVSRLCPIDAYLDWVTTAQIQPGPVYRAIDRWGHIRDTGLHVDSVVPLLRAMLEAPGVDYPERYTGHSLRRGFASWASSNGWGVKELMEYFGWKDPKSAIRYIEARDPFAQRRIEAGLSTRPARMALDSPTK